MKNILFLISAMLILSVSESFSEDYTSPFTDCYQTEFEDCNQQCADTLTFTKYIIYAGCPIEVSYKVRECNCPEPVAYVYITYIRINISVDETCCDLICELFPPGPFVKNCDQMQQELNCFNNPADTEAMRFLSDSLYRMIGDTLFNEISDNCICPNSYTIKYYWPSDCSGFCIYDLEERPMFPSTTHKDRSALIIPVFCGGNTCCGGTFTYCKDSQGEIHKSYWYFSSELFCDLPELPACPNLPDILFLWGKAYDVTWVGSTDCISPCYHGGN